MSLKRWKVDQAVERGRQARRDGLALADSPYKGGSYSLRGFWESGWREEDHEIRKRGEQP